MTIWKALLACALGAALGLLWDSDARAADERPLTARYMCVRTGGLPTICAMANAGGAEALKIADDVLDRCAGVREPVFPGDRLDSPEWQCFAERTYIKQRWGAP